MKNGAVVEAFFGVIQEIGDRFGRFGRIKR